ncbi:MAG TPA: hypothetical protein VGB20_03110 [bacterium]
MCWERLIDAEHPARRDAARRTPDAPVEAPRPESVPSGAAEPAPEPVPAACPDR